jgi:hypothetical protein
MRTVVVIASAGLLISCGVVGSPVPPEFVGVAPTIEKQKRQHALEAQRQAAEPAEPDPTLGSHDLDPPASHAVGIR